MTQYAAPVYEHQVETILKPILQNHLSFELNGRRTKSGRFVLYRLSPHSITFVLQNNKKALTNYRIPYPFATSVDITTRSLIFSYTMSSLFGQGSPVVTPASEYARRHRPSRYYNNTLVAKIQ